MDGPTNGRIEWVIESRARDLKKVFYLFLTRQLRASINRVGESVHRLSVRRKNDFTLILSPWFAAIPFRFFQLSGPSWVCRFPRRKLSPTCRGFLCTSSPILTSLYSIAHFPSCKTPLFRCNPPAFELGLHKIGLFMCNLAHLEEVVSVRWSVRRSIASVHRANVETAESSRLWRDSSFP